MLTALVVDPSLDARRRIGALLRLGGWQVHEATESRQALQIAAGREIDLVVTDVVLRGETGLALLARLRSGGSRARFLVITANPTDHIRAAATSVGALGCLAKPVNPRALIDFLRTRTASPAPQGRHLRVVQEVEDLHDVDVDADMMDRLHEMYISALPHRLSLIAEGARSGDAMAVASAAQALAGASGQLGHPEIAAVCQGLAADARRGIVAQNRLMQLQTLSLRATRTNRPAVMAVRGGF